MRRFRSDKNKTKTDSSVSRLLLMLVVSRRCIRSAPWRFLVICKLIIPSRHAQLAQSFGDIFICLLWVVSCSSSFNFFNLRKAILNWNAPVIYLFSSLLDRWNDYPVTFVSRFYYQFGELLKAFDCFTLFPGCCSLFFSCIDSIKAPLVAALNSDSVNKWFPWQYTHFDWQTTRVSPVAPRRYDTRIINPPGEVINHRPADRLANLQRIVKLQSIRGNNW